MAAFFTIRIEDADDDFRCRPDETVVAAAERAAFALLITKGGPRVPVGCRQGGCGVCRVQVVDGPYRVQVMSRAHVSADDQRSGYALACRLVPEGDLTLRLAPPPGARRAPATPNRP